MDGKLVYIMFLSDYSAYIIMVNRHILSFTVEKNHRIVVTSMTFKNCDGIMPFKETW